MGTFVLDQAGPAQLASMRQAIERYSDNPSAFLALNQGNTCFRAPGLDGVVAYRPTGRYLVQFGGPFAPEAAYRELLGQFVEHARSTRRKVVAIQLQQADAAAYAGVGFAVNQVGASYAVGLADFTLRGSRFVRLRNKISRSLRSGLTVTEADHAGWAEQLADLDARWLAGKGRHAKPLEFLVGQHGGPLQSHRRLFLGLIGSRLVGYISYSPVYGSRPGWLHDLSRRLPDGPPGVMEAINHAAIEVFRAERAPWLHFGFTPFTGLDPRWEMPTSSGWLRWLVGQLAARGRAVYPARSQLAYKSKWAPQGVVPEYVAFSAGASLSGFLHVFKAANAL
jgi:lysylphosphatidylglycerol synthetase-like protein (DUF2156 family)